MNIDEIMNRSLEKRLGSGFIRSLATYRLICKIRNLVNVAACGGVHVFETRDAIAHHSASPDTITAPVKHNIYASYRSVNRAVEIAPYFPHASSINADHRIGSEKT